MRLLSPSATSETKPDFGAFYIRLAELGLKLPQNGAARPTAINSADRQYVSIPD
jgi:hypothetical protein